MPFALCNMRKLICFFTELSYGDDVITVRIKEETHRQLTKIKGEMIQQTEKDLSYDQVILELIAFWHTGHGKG